MANENETHEEVCEEMRFFGNVPLPPMFAWRNLAELAEAAHKCKIIVKRNLANGHNFRLQGNNAALVVARAELTAKDAEIENKSAKIIETNAQVENLRRLLGSMLERCLPKCVNCEDVCDDCNCNAADIVPLVKLVLAGEAINLDDYSLTPLVKFAKNKDALEAKDAELARLKSCLAGDCERMRLGAEPCEGCHIERINERNEIIKEFIGCYDELDWCQDGDTHFCKEECAYEEDYEKCLALRIHRVMTKAREVSNG